MPDHENVPYIVIEREGGGVGPFLWGVLLGAGVALLLAPRSGEETQEEIRLRARKLRAAAEERVDSVRDSVTDTITRTRNQFQDRMDSVLDVVDTRGREAIESSRRVASDAREELRRRVAEARTGVDAALEDDDRADTELSDSAESPVPEVVITDVEIEEGDEHLASE